MPLKGKDFWGPPTWITLHILAFCLRVEVADSFREFLVVLTKLIPCQECRDNLVKKLNYVPPGEYLSSSEKAFLYTYIIHDLANQHISKQKKTLKVSPPFDGIYEKYHHHLKTNDYPPGFWGPNVWSVIHIFAATTTPENGEYFAKFLILLCDLLPDQNSRQLLHSFLVKKSPQMYLRSNHDTFFYSYLLHDFVNQRLGKKRSPPYSYVKPIYFTALGKECEECNVNSSK